MKVSMEQVEPGKEEVLIRYCESTPELCRLLRFLQEGSLVLYGKNEQGGRQLLPGQIYYFESVDDKIFAYTKEQEYQVAVTLKEVEERLKRHGFFRCNKSFVVNIDHIASVQSQLGNRIDAKLDNQEHIIISRRYVKEFRELLKGGIHGEGSQIY